MSRMSSESQILAREGQKILIVATQTSNLVKQLLNDAQNQVGASGFAQQESPSSLSRLPPSSFDAVHFVEPVNISQLDFSYTLRILRPSGVLFVKYLMVNANGQIEPSMDQVQSTLKLNGFIQVEAVNSPTTNLEHLRTQYSELVDGNALICCVRASKPAYEVGDSVSVNLSSIKTEAVKAWTLSANDMLDDEVLDSDMVLDDSDLRKPDPASLKAACTTDTEAAPAKRKACKNCTCGLAEELEAEKAKVNTASAKSSCGNCYLGDAFRCSSCPYRGLPAFKPGEKIQLPVQTMEDDI